VVEPFAVTGPGLSRTFAADLREDILGNLVSELMEPGHRE
jgi:hypothetical protein